MKSRTVAKYFVFYAITLRFFCLPILANEVANNFNSILQTSVHNSSKIKAINLKKEALKQNKIQSSANLFPNASFFVRDENKIIKEFNNTYLQSLGINNYDKSYGINYQFKIYDRSVFNQVSLAHRSYDWNYHKILKEEKRAKNELFINLLKYILNIYRVKSLENSLEKAEASTKEANLGFQLGSKTKIDVLRANANLMELKSEITRAKLDKQNSLSNFLALSDVPQDQLLYFENLNEIELQNELFKNMQLEKSISKFNSVQRTLNNDLIELNLEEQYLTKEKDQINANAFPTLKLEGSYQNQESSYRNLFSSPNRSHSVALILEIPINLGGQLISQTLERYYAIHAQNHEIKLKQKTYQQKIKNSSLNIESLISLIESLKINSEQFDELYRLTAISYKLGKASFLELLDVQDNLINAKLKYQENSINLLNELFEDEILTQPLMENL